MTDKTVAQEVSPQQSQPTKLHIPRKYKYTKKTGRPRKYLTPELLMKKIEQYFKGGAYKREAITPLGQKVKVPTPTISDLVLYLGFADRHSFYAYEQLSPEFSNAIKKARTMIEREYEMMLRGSSCGGAIFALKNFGWVDRQEVEHSVNINLHAMITEGNELRDRMPSAN